MSSSCCFNEGRHLKKKVGGRFCLSSNNIIRKDKGCRESESESMIMIGGGESWIIFVVFSLSVCALRFIIELDSLRAGTPPPRDRYVIRFSEEDPGGCH